MSINWSATPRQVRVTVDGNIVPVVSDVSISSSLDQLCTVAEFSLASRPAGFVTGLDVLVEWLDYTALVAYPLFGGSIDSWEVESSPWGMRVRCVDQLELFRRTRTGSDLNLSGMTDGEAWMALADYCGISYDPSDIHDRGYVLGAHEPIKWLADGQTPASQIIQELDSVFRTATMTISNDQPVRFAYDPFPNSGSTLAATFTRGLDSTFFTHRRSYAGRDNIQNIWVVNGVTIEDDNDCTRTPWAKAADTNPKLGSKVRIVEQTFSSDLIQDQSLAEAIVRWKIAETNREPNFHSLDALNDPNIHPGSLVSVVDTTYGIAANPRYFLVRSVQRSGPIMSLDLAGGAAGEEGTVTSGVEKVCGDTASDSPIDDGFGGLDDLDGFPDIGGIGFDDLVPPIISTPGPPDEPVTCEEIVTSMVRWNTLDTEFRTPWREVTGPWVVSTEDGSSIAGGEALVYELRNPSGLLYLNSDEDPNTQSDATDIEYGPGPVFTVCGEVAFCGIASLLRVGVTRTDTDAPYSFANIYGGPDGLETAACGDVRNFIGSIILGVGGGSTTDCDYGPSEFGNGALHRNTGFFYPHGGGTAGIPNSGPGDVPNDFEFHSFCVSFDLSDIYQQGYVETDVGGGHNRGEKCVTAGCIGGGEPLDWPPDPYNHNIFIQGSGAYIDPTCPPVQIKNLAIGVDNCQPNPDYTEPETRT